MELIIAGSTLTSDFELESLKKKEDFLIVGKSDKTITVVSKGTKIPIKEIAQYTRQSDRLGVVIHPTQDGAGFIEQYGTASVPSNSTQTIPFNQTFPLRVVNVTPTLRGDQADIGVTIKSITTTGFTVITVGSNFENVTIDYRAIGL